MPSQSTSPWQPFSASLARLIVRFWPADTKGWGLAFEAELSEITTPFASFRWLMGGFMLLTREWWKSFFRGWGRPVGVPAGSPVEPLVKSASRLPRTPRFITALLLLASAGILLHPEVRTSLGGVFDTLTNQNEEPSRWSSVRKLRTQAEKNRDPKLLAFLSLLSTDDRERLRLSDEAIARDSSFTWLYYENIHGGWDTTGRYRFDYANEMQRLQKWDPENGAVRLLAPEIIFMDSIQPSMGRGSYVNPSDWYPHLEDDARGMEWMSAMQYAFEAPGYDSYTERLMQLIRDVAAKYSVRDPKTTAYALSRKHIPNLLNIRTYGNLLVWRGTQAEHQGNISSAAEYYRQALRFAQRMRQGNGSLIESLIAIAVGKGAAEKLKPLLERTGHPEEASLVAFQLAEWKRVDDSWGWRNRYASLQWAGLTIQLAALLALFLAVVTCLSFCILYLRRRKPLERRSGFMVFFSWAADAGPLLLLAASTALFLVYHPFAQTYRSYLSATQPAKDLDGLVEASYVTHFSLDLIFGNQYEYYLWLAATLALAFLAISLILHMAFRHYRQRDVRGLVQH